MAVSAEYTAAVEKVARRHVAVVRFTNLVCPLGGTTEMVFASKEGASIYKRVADQVYPYVLEIPGTTVKIAPSTFTKTSRTAKSVVMADDYTVGKTWFDSGCTAATDGLSFWHTFVHAFPDYFGTDVEIISFFSDPGLTDLDKGRTIFVGQLENIRFGQDRTVELVVRDTLYFKNKSLPAATASSQKITSAMTSSSANVNVSDGSQYSDPDDWTNVHWPPPCVRIESEVIAYRNVAGNALRVARNYIKRSEEMAHADWTRTNTTVVDQADSGPWGGEKYNATEVEFTAAGANAAATGVEAVSGQEFHYSVWLKEHPDHPGETVRITLQNDAGTTFFNSDVTLTDEWQRFKVTGTFGAVPGNAIGKVQAKTTYATPYSFYASQHQVDDGSAFRPYVYTGASAGDDAGRGAYGTSAASHADDTAIREMMVYAAPSDGTKGLNPFMVFRSLCAIAEIPNSKIEVDDLDAERLLAPSDSARRFIERPRKIAQLVAELSADFLIDFWTNEDGLITGRLSYRSKRIGETIEVLDEADQILAEPPLVDEGKDDRLSRGIAYYEIEKDAQGREKDGTKPDDYEEAEVIDDPSYEGANGAAQRTKFFFTRWIYREAEADALVTRQLARFGDGARRAIARVGYRARGIVKVGFTYEIRSTQLTGIGSGGDVEATPVVMQMLSAEDEGEGTEMEVELLEAIGQNLAYYHASPYTGASDYDTDKAADPSLLEYAYWADTDARLGADDDPPYVWG